MRRSGSLVGREIDKLIEAGWEVLDTNFDPAAFRSWRKRVARVRILLKHESAIVRPKHAKQAAESEESSTRTKTI